MKGRGFSDREKEFIIANKESMFNNQIAVKLSETYPEDNGGSRSQAAVRRFIKKETSD